LVYDGCRAGASGRKINKALRKYVLGRTYPEG